ncbi:MAG: phosphate acetyltransferase [Prevotella sp.]|nr:phosphate acetyltransferase [Prevotella sp.]
MSLLEKIVERAKADKQRIVLPEAEEERTLRAADKVLADDIADLILIGNPANIKKLAGEWGLKNIDKATIVDPQNNPKAEEYAEKLAELRKKKGMTIEQARELVTKNNLYLGCMIIKTEGADGQISGALSTTGDTLRPALQIIKCAPGITCVSGAMLLITNQKEYGENGIVVMGDVAVTPNPTADQLAQIAYTTAQTAHSVAGFAEPRVAMLSFSTKGSAKDAINKATGKSVYIIDKVTDAVKIAHENYPDLKLDGELQADAALVPTVAAKKAPGSAIAGHANVLVVPNLEVGNIGYKLVQRLGGAIAIGPILQGIARPVNDLSRGCSVDDIYYMVAITACQAQDAKKA